MQKDQRHPESFGVVIATLGETRFYMRVNPAILMEDLRMVSPAAQRNMKDAFELHWPLNSAGQPIPLMRLGDVDGSDATAWIAAVTPCIELALPARFRSKESAEVPDNPKSLLVALQITKKPCHYARNVDLYFKYS